MLEPFCSIFKSIVYNQAKVYKRQTFLRVVFHVIFIDQSLDKIQVTVIYSRAILVAVASECC